MRVVCLGGGHGLHATLQAMRLVTTDITAIVCVGDDGGSSGRLREEFGVLPPGDIRMALSALASEQAQKRGVVELLQHRFTSEGDLNGHALGNLILTAQWQRDRDILKGIRSVQTIFGIDGTVLPGAKVPLNLTAEVQDPATGEVSLVHSQREVAKARGKILSLHINPEDPPAFDEAVEAIEAADVVTLGPGSWYSSLLVHMLVPGIREALHRTSAQKILLMNLVADWETTGLDVQGQIEAFRAYSDNLAVDAILTGDSSSQETLPPTAARVFHRRIATSRNSGVHDPVRLASAFKDVLEDLTQARAQTDESVEMMREAVENLDDG
ncbi:MAG: uridine diphosphate-N-acetylglucosamine-binding protein YvcK, partial [Bifidobacteriaceae bacterium]|nr:uridine diphosphate-N-acetylglucosamine-binding protein YvcK [Bifidobacteriaceae bacterium]